MSLRQSLTRLMRGRLPQPSLLNSRGPILVDLGPGQSHPVDLQWVDELMTSVRPHVMVRPEDELLILVPNSPNKMNRTAIRILSAMVDDGLSIRQVLSAEGDTPGKRRDLHYFFTDLQALLNGSLGEGTGRKGVEQEKFSSDFCHYPVISEIALTYRCNLSCRFCYADCCATGLPDGWSETRTMDDEQVIAVLDKLWHEARCPSISFTGGEPTLRPALPRFVAHARGLGMKVNLISNGQMLTEQLVGKLHDAGLHSVQLSLEGSSAEVHDMLVQRSGAFERLWAGAGRLRDKGIRVHTNTTISQGNLHDLEGIVDLVADNGHDRLTMNLVIPCGTAIDNRPQLHVPYTEIAAYLLKIQARAKARDVEFIWYSPIPMCIFNTVAHGLGNQGCAAADGLIHVNPAGDVLPCSSFEHGESLGNLLESSFDEVWQSKPATFFREKEMMPPVCRDCENNQVCQGACTLYWREAGLTELGGAISDRPPAPESWGCGSCGSSGGCGSKESTESRV